MKTKPTFRKVTAMKTTVTLTNTKISAMKKQIITAILLCSAVYFTVAQTYNPVAWWTFDQANYFKDSKGTYDLGDNGLSVKKNFSINTNGQVGQYLTVDSPTTGIITASSATTPDLNANAFTTECLFKVGDNFSSANLFSWYSDNLYLLQLTATGLSLSVKFQGSSASDGFSVSFTGIDRRSWSYYNDGNWHHFAVTFDAAANEIRFYIDGLTAPDFTFPVAPGKVLTTIPAYSGQMALLQAVQGQLSVDEAAVYYYPLDSQVIYQHYLDAMQGKHYNFTRDASIVVPAAPVLSAGVDSTEYIFMGDTVSAIAQLTAYPLPRYFPAHSLLENIPYIDFTYFGGHGQSDPNKFANSVALQTEMATHWHYPISLNSNANLVRDSSTLNDSLHTIRGFYYYWLRLANAQPNFKRVLLTGWGFVYHPEIYDTVHCQEKSPYVSKNWLPQNNYVLNNQGAKIQQTAPALRDCGTYTYIDTFPYWSPEAQDSFIELDGKATAKSIGFYLSKLNDKRIDFIGENGEVFPPPVSYVTDEDSSTLLQQDPYIVLQKNNSGLTWRKYAGGRFSRFNRIYRDQFMNLPDIAGNGTTYSLYAIDGNAQYRFAYDSMRTVNTFVNGQSYSTPDYYPQQPQFTLQGSGDRHGWDWLAGARKNELQFNDNLFAPFVAPGWYYDPIYNIAPAQWLGMLKALATAGAEYYNTGFFNYDYDPSPAFLFPNPITYTWQVALPSYAQAVTSRYEDILRNGTLLDGDGNYSFQAGDARILVTARKHNSQDKYVISGTVQPYSNQQGNAPIETTATVNLNGETLKFKVRRQGSVYIYDKTDASNIIFYQLDEWHEAKHPYYWTKDFELEAEVYDSANAMKIKTEKNCAAATATDYTDFTSYLSATASGNLAQYNFTPRSLAQSTLYCWVRARSKDSTATGVNVRIGSQVSFIRNIQSTQWQWYVIDTATGSPAQFTYLNAQQNYTLHVRGQNSKIEIDKIMLTPELNKTFADTPYFVRMDKTLPGCETEFGYISVVVCGGLAPYQYKLNSGAFQTSNVFSSLASGTYTVSVKDANGTVITSTVDLNNSVSYDFPNGVTISSNTTWTTDTKIRGELIITNGAVLTINNNARIEMYYKTFACGEQVARIVIEPNSKLIANGVTFTGGACANGRWEGIYLSGDVTANPLPAELKLTNCRVANAHIVRGGTPVTFQYPDCNNPGLPPAVGGILTADRSVFSNLEAGISLQFNNYTASVKTSFDSCLFIRDHASPWVLNEEALVNLNNMDKVSFVNCTFQGDYSLPVNEWGTGIRSVNSGYTLTGRTQLITNYFINLTRGIEAYRYDMSNRKLTTWYSRFYKVQKGIYVQGGDDEQIHANRFFELPEATSETGDNYGVYMAGSVGFDIGNSPNSGNSFNGRGESGLTPTPVNDLTAPATYGVVVENSATLPEPVVFHNNFNGLDFQIQSQEDNGELKIRCNNFSTAGTMSWVTFDSLRNQGIQCNNIDPAGNEWSDRCEQTTGQEIEIYLDASANGFNYFAFKENSTYATQPDCSTPIWKITYLDPNNCDEEKTDSSCDSPAPGLPPPPGDGSDTDCDTYKRLVEQKINAYETEINGAKAQLKRIDGGQTGELLKLINQEPPVSAISLTNRLLASLPLSERVMLALLHRKYPLPPSDMERIMIDNSRLPDEVMRELREHEPPLPPINLHRIEAAQNKPAFLRTTELQELINYDEGEISLLEDLLVKAMEFCGDTKERIKEHLKERPIIEHKKLLAGMALTENDFTGARAMVNTVSLMTDTIWWKDSVRTRKVKDENGNYCRYMNCIIGAKEQGREIVKWTGDGGRQTGLSEAEIQTIREVASSKTQVSYNAEVLLMELGKEQFVHPIKKINPEQFAKLLPKQEERKKATEAENFLSVVPNPATNQIFIESNYKNAEVVFYDLTGRAMKRLKLEGSKMALNTTQWTSGVYFFELRSGNGIERGKLMIAK